MSKSYKHYSEEERLSLVRSFYESGQSKYPFCKDHDLSSSGILRSWLAKHDSKKESLSLSASTDTEEMLAMIA